MLRRLLLAFALAFAPAPGQAQGQRIAESDGTHTLVHEVAVDAIAADVWTAIATADGWRTWAVPIAWTDTRDPELLETSYDPAARPGQPQTIQQRFIARIPGRMLAFRTVKAPAGFPDFEAFARVTSVIELIPIDDRRSRVRLTMTGYPDSEAGRRLLDFFDHGNAVSLERLRRRFRDGPIDWATEFQRTNQPIR